MSTQKILIVEDEVIVARDLAGRLRALGYAAEFGPITAAEAVAWCHREAPDLVLMDIHLADGSDGVDAARQIRDQTGRPVVFVTAVTDRATLSAARRAQPFGYVTKPFTEHELHTVIELALQLHRTETRLGASEARYRALVEAAHEAIVTADTADRITGWNRGAERLFQRAAHEVLGHPLAELVAPRDQESFRASLARVRAEDAPPPDGHAGEFAGRRRDGSEFPAELTWAQWETAAGRFVTATIRDVSIRRRTEERMRLQSAALAAAVNSVVITDPTGRIEWANPAFCRITGYTLAEVVGQNPRVLKSGRQPPEYYAAMWRAIAGGECWHGEFVNRRKDGTLYTEDVTIAPVTDAAGTIQHYIAIKQDISLLKRSLAELHEAHAELAAQHRALHAALVDARAAIEAKATFLAIVSHEIRTPLNGVLGMASLLRETAPLTAEQRDCVEAIRTSGDTLLALINDVLDFSKIESQRMELECAPFDLRRCLEEAIEPLAPRAREKHLDLAAQVDEAAPTAIFGDAVRLRQVLTNLVANGVKFTAQGEVVAEVRATPAPGGQVRLRFQVRDTGIGIPADKRDRLFQTFSQVDSSTTRIYGGTGLGLAISQRLVGLMGGRIEVDSTPGQGSAFSFEILAAPAELAPAADQPPVPAELAGLRALVVDDNPTNRRIFVAHLRRVGVAATEAAAAATALALLDSSAWPDVILTDMLMPEMDGLDFALAVRQREAAAGRAPPVPILMISSGGYHTADPRAAPARLAAALSKPLRRDQLLAAVARAVAPAAGSRPPLPPAATLAPFAELRAAAQRAPCRILLTEDNAVNRKVALGMITRLGYSADLATDGREAVRACREHAYDLVFMDVQMPELDGFAATRQIRAQGATQPKIIAMTANALEGDREQCLAAGMDDYLAKPIRIGDLQRAIYSVRAPSP